jgi:hypothetical protein
MNILTEWKDMCSFYYVFFKQNDFINCCYANLRL